MRSLLGEQLRLAVWVLAALFLTLGLLPLVFFIAPGLAEAQIGPVPIAWVLLGLLTYPWLVLLGWLHLRRAEANEADFAALVSAADEQDEP